MLRLVYEMTIIAWLSHLKQLVLTYVSGNEGAKSGRSGRNEQSLCSKHEGEWSSDRKQKVGTPFCRANFKAHCSCRLQLTVSGRRSRRPTY